MPSPLEQYIRVTPISELVPHPRNPRRGHPHAIAESIRTNGFFGTVVAQKGTGHILVGNHRASAAKALGYEEIPVAWIDVDDDAALRIMVADNRTADLAENDDAILAAILQELEASIGLQGTGFTDVELDFLIKGLEAEMPEYKPTNREVDPESLMGDKTATCPRCGFEFEVETP